MNNLTILKNLRFITRDALKDAITLIESLQVDTSTDGGESYTVLGNVDTDVLRRLEFNIPEPKPGIWFHDANGELRSTYPSIPEAKYRIYQYGDESDVCSVVFENGSSVADIPRGGTVSIGYWES